MSFVPESNIKPARKKMQGDAAPEDNQWHPTHDEIRNKEARKASSGKDEYLFKYFVDKTNYEKKDKKFRNDNQKVGKCGHDIFGPAVTPPKVNPRVRKPLGPSDEELKSLWKYDEAKHRRENDQTSFANQANMVEKMVNYNYQGLSRSAESGGAEKLKFFEGVANRGKGGVQYMPKGKLHDMLPVNMREEIKNDGITGFNLMNVQKVCEVQKVPQKISGCPRPETLTLENKNGNVDGGSKQKASNEY